MVCRVVCGKRLLTPNYEVALFQCAELLIRRQQKFVADHRTTLYLPCNLPPTLLCPKSWICKREVDTPSLPAFDSCSQAPLLARFTALYERKPNYHSTASSQLSRLDLGVRVSSIYPCIRAILQ